MVDILTVLQGVEMIALVVFIVFLFIKNDELSGHVVRVVSSSVLSIANILAIPLLIQADKSYILNVVVAIIWLFNVIAWSIKIGKKM